MINNIFIIIDLLLYLWMGWRKIKRVTMMRKCQTKKNKRRRRRMKKELILQVKRMKKKRMRKMTMMMRMLKKLESHIDLLKRAKKINRKKYMI